MSLTQASGAVVQRTVGESLKCVYTHQDISGCQQPHPGINCCQQAAENTIEELGLQPCSCSAQSLPNQFRSLSTKYGITVHMCYTAQISLIMLDDDVIFPFHDLYFMEGAHHVSCFHNKVRKCKVQKSSHCRPFIRDELVSSGLLAGESDRSLVPEMAAQIEVAATFPCNACITRLK